MKRSAFMGDFNWTAEALINILKNCVEHTAEGGEIIDFFFGKCSIYRNHRLRTTEMELLRKIFLTFSNGFIKEKMQVTTVSALGLRWRTALSPVNMAILK